ncbi:MAG: PEP-utilizing enzyme [Nannocystaceae bacterium]
MREETPLHRLGEPSSARLQAKAASLDRLRAAGLAVPPGLVVDVARVPSLGDDPRALAAIAGLLEGGAVIARSALALEDRADASGAGLGLSVSACATLPAVLDALAQIDAQRGAPWLRGPDLQDDPGGRDQVILQRQIAATDLLVIAAAPGLAVAVEVYAPTSDALAGASTPRFAGPLRRWSSRCAAPVEALVAAAAEALDFAELDLEIVLDAGGQPWLVQARPLTRALQPGWPEFSAALADAGDALPDGWWRLDAEHNPAPLSPAHAWLLERLGERPGTPRALAGWLYEPLDRATEGGPREAAFAGPRAALEHLQSAAIPAARRRLAAIDAILTGDPHDCAAAIEPACAAVAAMLDTYAALADANASPRAPTSRRAQPLCLRDRDRFLDVLPGAWDIAAPSLHELFRDSDRDSDSDRDANEPDHAAPVEAIDDDDDDTNAARWLLRELDDHLFALGLAPLRRVYLRAAEHLAAQLRAPSDVFLLRGPELAAALRGTLRAAELRERATLREERRARQRELRPPPQLIDGAPLPIAAFGHHRGLGLGAPCSGAVTRRGDLSDLLRRPPAAAAIVVIPALTAPAAVVLRRLGVRALISATGGSLSHAALMVRELGISALIGCPAALDLLEGEVVDLDTRRGLLLRRGR